ncbi:MAG: hypothetical protein ACREAB_20270, partial [Blastocatellia bacterium]
DANSWDVQQLFNRNRHGNAPWDDFDSLTPIYWGAPRRFPKTRLSCPPSAIASTPTTDLRKKLLNEKGRVDPGLFNFLTLHYPKSVDSLTPSFLLLLCIPMKEADFVYVSQHQPPPTK